MENKFYRWAVPILVASILGLIIHIFQGAVADRYTGQQAREHRAELLEKIADLHERCARSETRHGKLHDELHSLEAELRVLNRRFPPPNHHKSKSTGGDKTLSK